MAHPSLDELLLCYFQVGLILQEVSDVIVAFTEQGRVLQERGESTPDLASSQASPPSERKRLHLTEVHVRDEVLLGSGSMGT